MTAAEKVKLLALADSWDYTDHYECANELRALVAEMETPTRRLDPEIDMLTEEEAKRL
jgi:hypothetical protein